MKTSPPITVLLPVRNAAETLDRALNSLWKQTYSRFEVLAVDDHSNDDSAGILSKHARREPRLQVLAPAGCGLVAALEQARAHTASPYLARMDADDIAHPLRFSLQHDYLRTHPAIGAVGSRVVLFPKSRIGPGWRRYQRWINGLITPEDHLRELFVESPLAHPSVMLRATAMESVGGYGDPPWAEDYDLWFRLVEAGWHLAKVDAPLLAWRQTQTRLSLRSPRYHRHAFLAARAHYLARHQLMAGERTAIWGAGRTGRRLARLLLEQGVATERFYDVDPAKIGKRVGRIPVESWRSLHPPGGLPLIVAVGAPGARALIRPELHRRGYREGIHTLFAA